jgi:hypothetical protein
MMMLSCVPEPCTWPPKACTTSSSRACEVELRLLPGRLKPELLQRLRQQRRVIGRIVERDDVLTGRIADHQRDPLFCKRRACECRDERQCKERAGSH